MIELDDTDIFEIDEDEVTDVVLDRRNSGVRDGDGKVTERFKDGVGKIIGSWKANGYEFYDIYIRDNGVVSYKCEYCGTPIRYEFEIEFIHKDDGDKLSIVVGSTCVENFKDYIGAFDRYDAMKTYKLYRNLMMEIEEYENESEVPKIKYSEVADKLKELRRKSELVRGRRNYPEIFDFVEENKDSDEFYKNIWNRISSGQLISERQREVICKQMKQGNTKVDDNSEKLCDAWIFKSILDFAEKGIIDLRHKGRSDKDFMLSLYNGYVKYRSWSEKQYYWVANLINRYRDDLTKIIKANPGSYQCPECDSDKGVKFGDRGFSICPNGHIVRYPESVKNNLKKKEDWYKR